MPTFSGFDLLNAPEYIREFEFPVAAKNREGFGALQGILNGLHHSPRAESAPLQGFTVARAAGWQRLHRLCVSASVRIIDSATTLTVQ
jgi:hypothetical protein